MPTLSEDLIFRGLIHQMTDVDLPKRFDQPGLTVYAGFDPSADSLHVGNLMQLCTLRRFQEAGHRPISLAGGGTGMIGDPGGKQDERQLLDLQTIEGYLQAIRPQLGQFLDLADGRALLLNNADWLSTLSTLEYLRDVGKHFTVNQMVAKESVKSRFDRPDQGISYTEFSYMLLQAYDFLRLHLDHGCDVQFGGSDQWGNITMGVDYVRRVCGDEVWGFTTPLIVKADGTKYGKTESGTVWLDPKRTSPFTMYQFFLNTPDEQVGELLRFLTFLEHDEISALDVQTAEHPQRREAQRALARAVTGLVHGEAEVAKCEEASAALFGEEIAGLSEEMLLAVTEDAPSTTILRAELLGGLTLTDLLERTSLAKSRKQARRTVSGRRRLRQQRPTERRRAHLRSGRSPPRPVPRVAEGQETGAHHQGHMRRRYLVPSLVLMTGCALTLTSCAGADQEGSASHRMSVWVSGTSFGEDIGTLVADNARIPKDVPNGSGAVHAACSTLLNDAQMANSSLPSPDPDVTTLLTNAYNDEGTAANQCYDSGATNKSLLAESERNTIKAEALYQEALQRIRVITGRTPVTTTTAGNTGNSGIGGIFG